MVPNIAMYSGVVSASILQIPVLWTKFCSVVLPVPIYTTIYYCRWKILAMLKNSAYSEQTKLMIKRLVKVPKQHSVK
ncbi:hypothetical protein ANCDUO_22774 [Ancylostoma duodenale]|uniref:Uncharacterized protein n=1 Tax=Ancylostoma duodenale TaxID=51022 RepID=A0A0C2FF00_9BILA|nr:hypothetical protein ANCDUO_22774 [Ancylostoma duodenale]